MRRHARARLVVERLDRRLVFAVAAPANFVATPVSAAEIGLSWELADASDAAVVVERRSGPTDGFVPIATLTAGEAIFSDTGCWAGTTYTYRVQARNAAGDSAYSTELTTTSLPIAAGAFEAVTGLAAVPRTPTTAEIAFVDHNAAEASHLLERSADGVSWAVVASLGGSTTWRDTGLDPGATYW